MNCTEANKINIAGFLMSKGIHPAKQQGNSFWYCSPLRNEKTPSFKIDRSRNRWFDFGTYTHGSLIDLICQMYHVDVPGALLILSGARVEHHTSFVTASFPDRQKEMQKESGLEILQLQPLQNRALIRYLTDRKINPAFASAYCREVYYNAFPGQVKPYFAIGFKNDDGGYELRNGIKSANFPKGFKGSTSPKSITTITGKNSSAVNVFEGFMDFFSELTHSRTVRAGCDTIILNGVGFIGKFIEQLPKYSRINLYLDNDTAGKEAARRVLDHRPDAVNRSQIIYPKYKDFNDFLLGKRM